MRYFSIKIFIACILIPPVLYIATMVLLEDYLKNVYTRELNDVYIGDAAPLLKGGVTLEDAVTRNIDRYLDSRRLLSMGVDVTATVTTGDGKLLYPSLYDGEKEDLLPEDPMKTAAENFQMMNEGIDLKVDLKLGHNTLLANLILGFYILLSVSLLWRHFRKASKRAQEDEEKRTREIHKLSQLDQERRTRLQQLDLEKSNLSSDLDSLKEKLETEKSRASRNEEELIEDIVALEKKIQEKLSLQEEQQKEIEALKSKIDVFEKSKKRKTPSGAVQKRFKALYKNLSVSDRAVDGFMDLTEDLKIKCEEIIHLLDQDPKLVNVKRKVFGKKNRETVLEVIFAYKGRLYFRSSADGKVEVLAVGTKNTQARELEYLDSL